MCKARDSAKVVSVTTGVKAPVHRMLESAKSKTIIADVVDNAAGRSADKLFVDIARMKLMMFRLRDCRMRWIWVASLRSLVTV